MSSSTSSPDNCTNNKYTMTPLCEKWDFDTLELGFMVQPSALYLNIHHLRLIFSLLSADVDPVTIPDYVRMRHSDVVLTMQDVHAIKNGRFHISGRIFAVILQRSGTVLDSDTVDDFYRFLSKIPSPVELKSYMFERHGFLLDDSDLLDLHEGAHTVDGPPTPEFTTRDKFVIPQSQCVEAVYMFEKCCDCNFISQYFWYRFHSHVPACEITRLTLGIHEDKDEEPVTESPCLLQTTLRARPALATITADSIPMAENVDSVQLSGSNCSENSDVLFHQDEGMDITFAECGGNPFAKLDLIEPFMNAGYEPQSSLDHPQSSPDHPHSTPDHPHSTPDHPRSTPDQPELPTDSFDSPVELSAICDDFSRFLFHRPDGDFLMDLEQPGVNIVRVPRPQIPFASDEFSTWLPDSSAEGPDSPKLDQNGFPLLCPSPPEPRSSLEPEVTNPFHSPPEENNFDMLMGISSDDDLVLDELTTDPVANPPYIIVEQEQVQAQTLDQALADLPTLGSTTFEGWDTPESNSIDLQSLLSSDSSTQSLLSPSQRSDSFNQTLNETFLDMDSDSDVDIGMDANMLYDGGGEAGQILLESFDIDEEAALYNLKPGAFMSRKRKCPDFGCSENVQ